MEKVYTYILQMKDGRRYTGITKDIAMRLQQHRMGESKSTVKYRPVELIWLQESDSREEARELEVKIKNMGVRRFLISYPRGNLGQSMIKPLNENLGEMIETKGDE